MGALSVKPHACHCSVVQVPEPVLGAAARAWAVRRWNEVRARSGSRFVNLPPCLWAHSNPL
jgi:hypothetical protein